MQRRGSAGRATEFKVQANCSSAERAAAVVVGREDMSEVSLSHSRRVHGLSIFRGKHAATQRRGRQSWRLSLCSGLAAVELVVSGSARLKAGHTQEALPNPSFKRSPNGMAPGPRAGVVYHPARGPGAMPLVPA